jgi:hypothetical protein
MVIEVVYVAGFEPSAQSITNFVNFLSARTLNQVVLVWRSVYCIAESPHSNEERVLKMLIEPNTIQQTKLQFGLFLQTENLRRIRILLVILGTAYRNTSLLFMNKTSIQGNYSNNHEFGHILGLTNLVQLYKAITKMQNIPNIVSKRPV